MRKELCKAFSKVRSHYCFYGFLGGDAKLMKTSDFLKFYTLYFSGGIWLPLSKGVSLAVHPLGMRTFDLLTVSLVEASATGVQSQFTCYIPTLPT